MPIDNFFREFVSNLAKLFETSVVFRSLLIIPFVYFVLRIPCRIIYSGMTGRSRRSVFTVPVSEPEPEPEPEPEAETSCEFQCCDTSCPWYESKKYCENCNRFRLCSFCSSDCDNRHVEKVL